MPVPGLRDKDVEILRGTFRNFSFVQEVRVFGSRANGVARRSSDLDLAISSAGATPTEWAELCDALQSTPIIYELTLCVLKGSPMSDSRQRLHAKE